MMLVDRQFLQKDSGMSAGGKPGSLWAVFVSDREDVDTMFAKALAAGGVQTSAVQERVGGFYSGYFADPEGNGWEIVWHEKMTIDTQGALVAP